MQHCSFCGRPQSTVAKLIAGPSVAICTVCIADAVAMLWPQERRAVFVAPEPDGLVSWLGSGAVAAVAAMHPLETAEAFGALGVPPERLGALVRRSPEASSSSPRRCSFCGRSHTEVRALLVATEVCICEGCAVLCHEIVAEEQRAGAERSHDPHAPLEPFALPHGVRLLDHRHGWQLDVTPRGLFLSSLATWSLQLVGLGRGDSWHVDLSAIPSTVELDAAARRVVITHGTWAREAFANGPHETTHDLELLQRPGGDPAQPLRLVYSVRGTLRPRVWPRSIDFTDAAGSTVVRLGHSHWRDAHGTEFLTRVELGSDETSLELVVDDHEAHYPLRLELGST